MNQKVSVLGDSNATALYLAARSLPGYDVRNYTKSGRTVRQMLDELELLIDSGELSGTKVILCVGGNSVDSNRSTVLSDYSSILNTLKSITDNGNRLSIVLPPPATVILDVPLARKVFGSKITDEYYWFSSGYAERRFSLINALAEVCIKSGTHFIILSANTGGGEIGAPSVGVLPLYASPDGIHMSPQTARSAAALAIGRGAFPRSGPPAWAVPVLAVLLPATLLYLLIKHKK